MIFTLKARSQWRTKIYLPSALMGLALEGFLLIVFPVGA